jgi:hypothetical protein
MTYENNIQSVVLIDIVGSQIGLDRFVEGRFLGWCDIVMEIIDVIDRFDFDEDELFVIMYDEINFSAFDGIVVSEVMISASQIVSQHELFHQISIFSLIHRYLISILYPLS